jgi:hypothetical protein
MMQIKTVTKKDGFFEVLTEDDRLISVPDDLDNTDRKEVQEWLDAGNELHEIQEAMPLVQNNYNWEDLLIAFKRSQLNKILDDLKDENTNPQISPIWRSADDLVQVMMFSALRKSDSATAMTHALNLLFQRLEEGQVVLADSVRPEIYQALEKHGFVEVVQFLTSSPSS